LLWDYNLYDDEDPAPCYCGSPKCRGTMYSEDWIKKLERRAARKKKAEEIRKNGNAIAAANEKKKAQVRQSA
jgi:hypothetical protein